MTEAPRALRLAILDDIHNAYAATAGVKRLKERAERLHIFTGPFGPPQALAGFNAVIANRERTRFDRALLAALPDLRIIAQTGNHAYHIDLAEAEARGIIVAKATGRFSRGAGELAIGLMIALMRQIPASDRAVKDGVWRTPTTPVLNGKTLGIVGLGHVGGHVAKIAGTIGMRTLAWSPHLDPTRAATAGAEPAALDELLAASDIVSIHATLTPQSRGLIDARRLSLMKPSAFLINTARGAIVDEAALVQALAAGRIAGAGLDVFTEEPLPRGHALTKLPNVILTPHLGWPTDQAYADFAAAAADALLAWLDGREVARFESGH
ncbi:MAG TPA: NAD(P)-dependent oxidoreductase [Stellaceae bacterium]|nr:NAD(P)-dependent oxidoreductase [Stellaceae bacterium]